MANREKNDVLFSHLCSRDAFPFEEHKQPLIDSDLSQRNINLIWDFYVARSPSESSGLSITLKDYGWNDTKDTLRLGSLAQLEASLLETANIPKERCAIIRRKSIDKTLNSLALSTKGCICCPRIALTQDYSIEISEKEELKYGSKESRMHCLFRHIRNSLAHGNTYLFDNDFIMLEDKYGKTETAKIMIHRRTLIDWIFAVDKNEIYYKRNGQ